MNKMKTMIEYFVVKLKIVTKNIRPKSHFTSILELNIRSNMKQLKNRRKRGNNLTKIDLRKMFQAMIIEKPNGSNDINNNFKITLLFKI
jgi:hypothetical protein